MEARDEGLWKYLGQEQRYYDRYVTENLSFTQEQVLQEVRKRSSKVNLMLEDSSRLRTS